MKSRFDVGIKALRWLTFLIILWMVLEAMRVYYLNLDMKRFLMVTDFLKGPWFAMFSVAAGGSHLKRWTEGLKAKSAAVKDGLQGLTG
jgi:hypothetical protein